MVKSVLTVAGSDSSGGAGIQADIKTITCMGKYAMSVVTSLTAQNTLGVFAVEDAAPEFVKKQLDCVFDDIFPDSVKIGMVSNREIITSVADKLCQWHARNIVADPVMVSTSGCPLLDSDAARTLIKDLLPLADLITPNIPEAEVLSGIKIACESDIKKAAEIIFKKCSAAVLIKGGHSKYNANDHLFDGNGHFVFKSERIDNKNTHGTGCTLSSAIACGLADGSGVYDSVLAAKEYVKGALEVKFDIGKGNGPLLHNYKFIQAEI